MFRLMQLILPLWGRENPVPGVHGLSNLACAPHYVSAGHVSFGLLNALVPRPSTGRFLRMSPHLRFLCRQRVDHFRYEVRCGGACVGLAPNCDH